LADGLTVVVGGYQRGVKGFATPRKRHPRHW
jgi:hypothetical protein